MPNHFHWLLYVRKVGKSKNVRETRQTALSGPAGEEQHPLIRKIAVLLSSYTQAINKQEQRSGSLFRQKTKSIKIDSREYGRICLYYIHHNPLKANLVDSLLKWEYSSFPDYAGIRSGSLINKKKTMELLSVGKKDILKKSCKKVSQNKIKNILE
ncbi:hypothetical protein [Fodinibius salsisoli]|uniref:Transposase IS200 like n=1 Tax=Fodinibius salsisoli TaxID=2820877 RepID=A0ABT3PSN6_9BACT|nr:hypothetical protein [Fodinibius salsisoli]MCW9708883.1 hypothetical protein [Fodinibius salsisoli]